MVLEDAEVVGMVDVAVVCFAGASLSSLPNLLTSSSSVPTCRRLGTALGADCERRFVGGM